jgi:hypothetical protein
MLEGATTVLEQSRALAVKTPATRQQAADLWDAIRAFRKQAEAQKETVCRPLKTAWDEAKKPWDAFVKECTEVESKLQKVMGEWDREQDRLAREEQAKIQAKIDAENAKKLAKAEAKGQDLSEVVLKVAPVVQAPAKAIETQAGTTQQRIEKTVYGIKGAVDNEDMTAVDPRIAGLLKQYPVLFAFDWVAYRKLASTGMLDTVTGVDKRTEYVYAQRGGK